jgi:hypothetical protein
MKSTYCNRKVSKYRVQIHGCVFFHRDPLVAFAELDALITIGDCVRAEFRKLWRKLKSHQDNHDVTGNAVVISRIYE